MAAVGSARSGLNGRDQTIAAVFGLWMIVGLFLDGWAHDNQKPETFFTPWHGVLYSGFTAAAAFALHRAVPERCDGVSIRAALPRGHGLTLAAFGAFALGALGDLVWHEVLGIEVGVEALVSPTHLLLLASGLVALSAPIRAAWLEPTIAPGLRSFLPVALSATLLTSLVMFFVLYLSPFANNAAGTAFERLQGQVHDHPSHDIGELQQLLGLASILITSVVLAAPIALLLRRWRTPAGTFTLVFGILVLLLEGLNEFEQAPVALVGVGGGAVADVLVARRKPVAVVAGGAIASVWLAYFGSYAVSEGSVAWTAELWTGSTFLGALLAAGIGLLSGVAVPASSPE